MQYNKSANLRRWQSVGGVRLARPLPPPLPRLWYRSSRGRSENGLESSARCCWLANPHLAGLRLASPRPPLPFPSASRFSVILVFPSHRPFVFVTCHAHHLASVYSRHLFWGDMRNSPPPKSLQSPPKPTEAANVLNKISCPLACSWYYCVHFIARSKAACALRFSWAATSSNLGL